MNLRQFLLYSSFIISLGLIGCNKNDSSSPTSPEGNTRPRILNVEANPSPLFFGETATLRCFAEDDENDELDYEWDCNIGSLYPRKSQTVEWTPPEEGDDLVARITAHVSDNEYTVSEEVNLSVMCQNDTVYVSQDVGASSLWPDLNSEGGGTLYLYNHGDNGISNCFVQFDVSDGPLAKSAKLFFSIGGKTILYGEGQCDFHEINEPWDSDQVTWSNKPSYDFNNFERVLMPEFNDEFEEVRRFEIADITEIYNKWTMDPSANYGFAMVPITYSMDVDILSSDNTYYEGHQPFIAVEYGR